MQPPQQFRKRFLTWANVLTTLRLLTLAPLVLAIINQYWVAAGGLFAIAVITDFYDGKIARKLQQTSPFGGLFDHATDALFVTLGCYALAQLELINSLLAIFIPLAFVQYMLDSKALAGVALRMSAIGKANGVAYYVLVGVAIGAQLLDWAWLAAPVEIAAWVLVATTTVSMIDRAVTLLQHNGRKQ